MDQADRRKHVRRVHWQLLCTCFIRHYVVAGPDIPGCTHRKSPSQRRAHFVNKQPHQSVHCWSHIWNVLLSLAVRHALSVTFQTVVSPANSRTTTVVFRRSQKLCQERKHHSDILPAITQALNRKEIVTSTRHHHYDPSLIENLLLHSTLNIRMQDLKCIAVNPHFHQIYVTVKINTVNPTFWSSLLITLIWLSLFLPIPRWSQPSLHLSSPRNVLPSSMLLILAIYCPWF